MSQVYSVNTLGGNWSAPELTARLRHVSQPRFALRQFIDVKEAMGRKKGDSFLYDKVQNVASQGGTLVETSTIPETNYVTQQGTVVVTEYGNSVPFTGKLDALGQFEVDSVTEMKLVDDQVKVLESAAGDQFAATDFIAVNTASGSAVFTTNGTATATATANLTGVGVRSIVDFMLKKLIPPYDGNNYICVGSVAALSGLHGDTAAGGWQEISKHTANHADKIFNREIGNYYRTRFVEETGYLSNTIGNSSAYGQAVFFGADAVYEAVVEPENIRVKVSADYGRDMGLAWYAILGFKLVWDFSVDSEQHVVFVTSA